VGPLSRANDGWCLWRVTRRRDKAHLGHIRVNAQSAVARSLSLETSALEVCLMVDLPAGAAMGIHDSFSSLRSPAIVVVLAGPKASELRSRLLVNCVITNTADRDLEITCAD